LANRLQGVNVDFEEAVPEDREALVAFLGDMRAALAPAGLLVTADVPVDDPAYALDELADQADFLMPMLYDEHEAGSGPGPVASESWLEGRLEAVWEQVPPEKLVLALGNFGYDWIHGKAGAVSDTFQAAVLTAKESYDPEDGSGTIYFDARSRNPHFEYTED